MLRWGLTFVLALVVAVGAFLSVEYKISKTFQACLTEYTNQQRDQVREQGKSRFRALLVVECSGKFIDANHGALTAIATLLIATFTATLWIATIQLQRTGERQNRTTRILERAFMSVEPGGLEEWQSRRDVISCDVIMRNVGKLPARNVRWSIQWDLDENRHRSNFSLSDDLDHGPIVVAPGTRAINTTPTRRTDEFEAFLTNAGIQDRFAYVWGEVRYDDGFGVIRWIKFCHRYNVAAAVGAPRHRIAPKRGRYHENGNSTSED